MPHVVPAYLAVSFAAVVLAMAGLLVAGVHRGTNGGRRVADQRAAPATLTAALVTAWLVVTGMLAACGWLGDFSALPPRMAAVILPAVGLVLYLGLTERADALLRRLPPHWALAAQAFRVPVEVLLWCLYAEGLIAREMTFHGANLDILTGATAPFAAWAALRMGPRARPWLVAWNVAGLALLLNVVTWGLLSAPTPFRAFVTDPPNTVIAVFPVVWLPAFLVPCAMLLHAVSLRQLLAPSAAPSPDAGTPDPDTADEADRIMRAARPRRARV
jgi:hypothetical protein